jgi:hypothetical protein
MRAILVTLLLAALTGCTIYGDKKPPTLKSTSSAEQYERILWKTVQEKRWVQVPGLLSNNLMYSTSGKVLGKDQTISYLQSENITGVSITNMVVKPNGPDMTLNYTLQLSVASGPPQTLTAVSVWQQVGSDWILIAHMEQPATS